jgi:hypothetical protein
VLGGALREAGLTTAFQSVEFLDGLNEFVMTVVNRSPAPPRTLFLLLHQLVLETGAPNQDLLLQAGASSKKLR